ncbi:hypothetical protein MY3296_003942 [Beauveria thailandica]
MAPTTAQLRGMVSQFTAFTGTSEKTATKFIKASNYRVNEAVDEYFRSQGLSNQAAGLDSELDSLFDSLRDDNNDTKDRLELTSTMNYLTTDLKVNIENAELFVVLELLQAPSIGEISRKGYVEGWRDSEVYKHTFVAGREKDQKSLSLENALVYWDMLFAPPGMQWKNEHRDWLPLWKKYLNEKWHHSVNRDMWNMTLEFAFKSMEDDSLSFWDENGAWPGAIDDFVAWCKANGMSKSEQMEVDDA